MSDTRKNGRRITGKHESPLKGATSYRDFLASSSDDMRADEVVTMKLPAIDVPGLSMSAELRAISIPLPTLYSQTSYSQTSAPAWLTEEDTWMLPVVSVTGVAQRRPEVAVAPEKGKQQAGSQNYLSLAVEMVKSSGIYAIGALASPLVSLILTPFLAQHLSRTDYGGLSVLYTIVDLVTVITQLGLGPAFFRAYNGDYETRRDRMSILSATIILLSLVSIPIALVMVVAAPWLSLLFFGTTAFTGGVKLTALVIVMENLTLPGISWFRAEKRPIPYSVLSVINLLVVLGTNISLVGVLHIGLNGALIAKGAGFAAMIIGTLPMILLRLIRNRNLNLRFDIIRSMLTFGIPTIFSDVASWVLQLSDRFLLSHFASLAETASYSVAYVLGGVLSPVVLAPWGLAWIPIMYSVAKRDDAAHIFKLVFRWWSGVLLFAAFGLSLLSTVLLDTLFPLSYRAAEPIIPLITLSTMLQGVWYIFMIGVNIRRKTILEFVYVVIAAIVNLLLNLFFIPHFGAIGAGVSTLISYGLLTVISYIVNQRLYPIGFEIGSFILRLLIGVVLYIAGNFLAHGQAPLISWAISLAFLVLYGVILMAFAGLSPRKIISLLEYAQSAIRKGQKKTYENTSK
jgi:O-antigen/teichoic acid export membrane protein